MKRLALLLLTCLLLVSCGGSEDITSDSGVPVEPTATVELKQSLLRGVVNRVDSFQFTGFQDGAPIFGPVTVDKAAAVRVQVPVRVDHLRIEYLSGGKVVGNYDQDVQLFAGQTLTIEEPLINLLVATTTLDRSIVPTGEGVYKKLTYGPAWTLQIRTELAQAQSGREQRRVALACMPHFSDVHLIDEENPLRIEFLRDLIGTFLPRDDFQAAWRPQEMLTCYVIEAMVQQVNALAVGPITGRPFDCVVFTGDNGDDHQRTEITRFLTLMDGGLVTPSTGNPDLYEGVQDEQQPFLPEYWHPEPGPTDTYKTMYGFPDYPGLLTAAVQPFTAQGLKTPWYTCYGNHDELIQGNFPDHAALAPVGALNQIAAGTQKILALPFVFQLLNDIKNGVGTDAFLAEFTDPLNINVKEDWPAFIGHWTDPSTMQRTVTPDPERQIMQRADFVNAMLSSPASPGPVGHGLTAANAASGKIYYTFEPAPGILGIVMDTTNPGGLDDGSIDIDQVNWLEQQIQSVSSKYYDSNGNLITTSNQDKLVVLFSHHGLETMTNDLPDPSNPLGQRLLGFQFEPILHRYPNVVLWLNGHTHYNRIYPHPDPAAVTNGFWEVNSPSLIDYPHEVRVVELVDNKDGTLSFFTTLVDDASDPETGTPGGVLSLAAISRELASNDPQILNQPGGLDFQIGQPTDRNAELLIKKPF